MPPKMAIGNTHGDALLTETVVEIHLRSTEAVFDRGPTTRANRATFAELGSRVSSPTLLGKRFGKTGS